MLRMGSLFSGIGGLERGLEQSGIARTVWQVEIDPFCRQVLATHWPMVKRYDDVRNVHSSEALLRRVETFYGPIRSLEERDMAGKLKKLTPEQAEESVKMYDAGLSCGAVADYFNVSRQAMWDLLRRRTQMRPRERYGSDNHFFRGGSTEDDHAQNLVESALRSGALQRRDACEECGACGKMKDGRTVIQAHHYDYNKPLDVKWLCQKCHHEWHKKHQAKRKEVPVELAQVDLICGGFP